MQRPHVEGVIHFARTVQLGLRGLRFVPEDIPNGFDAGSSILTMDDCEEIAGAATIEAIRPVAREQRRTLCSS